MRRFLSTVFLLLLFVSASFAQALHPCAQLVWSDEFDEASLDLTKWTPTIGDGCDVGLCGWGNNELEYYTDRPENLTVNGGNLMITALKETYNGHDYTSAKITSIHKGDFTYGRVEARIKVPKGAGSWPAFWMLSTDETYGAWPQSGEIDIMENQGKTPTFIAGTAHYGDPIPNNKYNAAVYYLPSGQFYYDDFHIFTMDWDSTSIKWYMDGNLYHTFTKDQVQPYNWPFDKPFYLILNNAIGGNLGGTVDDASMPQTMEVDYVRVYSSPMNFRIIGNQQLFVHAANEKYYVPDVAGATDYQWTVPVGASIVSGQGSAAITVNWGDVSSAGNVSLKVIKACGSLDLVLPVKLLDDADCMITLDDMDGNTNVHYQNLAGNDFYSTYDNPNTVGNTSATCGLLYKSLTTDKFIMEQLPITDYSLYEQNKRIISMDLYTTASIGTTIELRLMNKAKSSGTYPAGVRTILRATTGLTKKWETLLFNFDHIEDANTLISEIDQIEVVFDPQGNTVRRYFYFDNIQRSLLAYDTIVGDGTPVSCDMSNEIYTVDQSPSSSYQWTVPIGTTINSGQNTNQISVNWASITSGKIYLQKTISSCTSYTGSLNVKFVSCPTSVLNPIQVQALEIYPNPSPEQVTVTCDLPALTDVKLVVTSSLGEILVTKIYNGQSGTFTQSFSLQELKPGSYILQLMTGSDIRSSQLIKY